MPEPTTRIVPTPIAIVPSPIDLPVTPSLVLPPPQGFVSEPLLQDSRMKTIHEATLRVLDTVYLRPGFANISAFAAQRSLDSFMEQHGEFLRENPRALAILTFAAAAHEQKILSTATAYDAIVKLVKTNPPDINLICRALTLTDPQILTQIAERQGQDLAAILERVTGPANAASVRGYLGSSNESQRVEHAARLLLGVLGSQPVELRSALRSLFQTASLEARQGFETQLRAEQLGARAQALGADFLHWLQATIQGNTVRADAIRFHEAITIDCASGRQIVDSLLSLPPDHLRVIDAEYRSRYGTGLAAALPADTSVLDRRLFEAAISPDRSVQRIEALLMLRSLNVGGNRGPSGFAVDVHTVNQLIRGKDAQQVRNLMEAASSEFATINPGSLLEQLSAKNGAFELSIVRTLIDCRGMEPARLARLVDQAAAFAKSERELRGHIGGMRERITNLSAAARNHSGTASEIQSELQATTSQPRGFLEVDAPLLLGGVTGGTQARVTEALTDLEYSSGLRRTAILLLGNRNQATAGGVLIAEQQLASARTQFEAIFATALRSVEGSSDFTLAHTHLEATLKALKDGYALAGRSYAAARLAYVRGVGQGGIDLARAVASLDSTERGLRATRSLLVIGGAVLLTGGLAGGAALTLESATTAVGWGTAAGTGIGGLSNSAEALSHVNHGTRTAADAFTAAGWQTLEDLRQSFNASLGCVAGVGVARYFRPEQATILSSLGTGALAGGANSTVHFSVDAWERYIIATRDFRVQFGALTGEARSQARAQFFRERALDFRGLSEQANLALAQGLVIGGVSGASAQMRTYTTRWFGQRLLDAKDLVTGGALLVTPLIMDADGFGRVLPEDIRAHPDGPAAGIDEALGGPNAATLLGRSGTSAFAGWFGVRPGTTGGAVIPPTPPGPAPAVRPNPRR